MRSDGSNCAFETPLSGQGSSQCMLSAGHFSHRPQMRHDFQPCRYCSTICNFLWSLTTAFRHATQTDFGTFVNTNQVVNDSLVTGPEGSKLADVSKWASKANLRTCQYSIMTVIEDDDHTILQHVVRSSFAVDDSDGTRCLRLRVVVLNPVVFGGRTSQVMSSDNTDKNHKIAQTQLLNVYNRHAL